MYSLFNRKKSNDYCEKCIANQSVPYFDNYSVINKETSKTNILKPKLDARMFAGIKVKTIGGDEILLSETWRNRPVVLKVLASLGCALCKYDAKVFSELQPLFESHNIGLVAVVFEDVDLYSFLSSGYWSWQIYLDKERKVYDAAKLTKVTRAYQFKTVLTRYFFKLVMYVKNKGFNLNMKADLRQLGGTFLITPDNEIKYSFRPKKFAMYPSIKEIYSLVGGDPEEIDEALPDEYIYTEEQCRAQSISSASVYSSGSYY